MPERSAGAFGASLAAGVGAAAAGAGAGAAGAGFGVNTEAAAAVSAFSPGIENLRFLVSTTTDLVRPCEKF